MSVNWRRMTYSKLKNFKEDQQSLAKLAKALSHPARIAILQYLALQKSCISGDISREIPLSRTTVSQHLQELKEAGLIDGEVTGVKVCYCINAEALMKCRQLLECFLKSISEYKQTVCQ